MAKKLKKSQRYYVGVDVGGTKILAALAKRSGKIVARRRCVTPRTGAPEETLEAVITLIEELLEQKKIKRRQLRGIGLAVPGIVDHADRIVVTPNMNLSGFKMTAPLEERFGVPIALGNDVNLGTLGEQWLGAAVHADSAVGIFVGTGIGGGIIVDGHLVLGHRGAAAEIGHMRMEKDGPACSCGAHGCLEAFASRSAIERNLREAVAAGRQTVLSKRAPEGLTVIRSNLLRRALNEGDGLVQEVMTHAAEILGEACLEIRHLLDPEVIILGGGVIEACGFFILPIVERIVAVDPLGGPGPVKIVPATLGDDAVVLGAVALVQQKLGRDPIQS